jgi:hypothetical protein
MRGAMPKRLSPRGTERRQGAGPAGCSPRAISDRYCSGVVLVKPEPEVPTMLLLP